MKGYFIHKSLYENFKIEEIEVLSQTEKTITIVGYGGRVDKKSKNTDNVKFAQTPEEAKEMRTLIIDNLIKSKESQILYLENEIEKLQKSKNK